MRMRIRPATFRFLVFLAAGLTLSLAGGLRFLLGATTLLAVLGVRAGLPRRLWRMWAWTCLAPLPGLSVLFLLAGREASGAWGPALAWGLGHLAPYAARIGALMLLNLVYIHATPLPELLAAFRGLPIPGHAALLLATLARFLPTVLAEAQRILEVQRCRGLRRRRLLTPAGLLSLAVPLFLAQLKRSQELALSLEIKGYAGPGPTAKGATSLTAGPS